MDLVLTSCSCGRVFDTDQGLNRAHRCRQCYDGTELLCQHFMVDRHAFLPFHILEVCLTLLLSNSSSSLNVS